jgi:hypothetical protein
MAKTLADVRGQMLEFQLLVRRGLLLVALSNHRMNDEYAERCRATADELEIRFSSIKTSAIEDNY